MSLSLTLRGACVRKRLLQIGLIIGCWTVLALLFVPQTYSANSRTPQPLTVWQSVVVNLILFYTWGALTPLVLWLGRRFPLERRKLLRNFLILASLEVPLVLFHMRFLDVSNVLLLDEVWSYQSLTPLHLLFINIGAFDIMIYWAILAISLALIYFKKYQEREFRLVQAQLQILKMQLHPHFLFNTLNAISELVYESPEKAERTITQLSNLLRLSLKSGNEQEVTLKEELDFLQEYVEIQQILMEERLIVCWDIQPQTLNALIPNLILQPLVENSIRHGLGTRSRGGTIEIKSWITARLLHLKVLDNGVGLESGAEADATNGVGLANARARLAYLYGDAHSFALEDTPAGGLTVSLAIPFREGEGRTSEDSDADR
jgi:signal transduction histidine kinase